MFGPLILVGQQAKCVEKELQNHENAAYPIIEKQCNYKNILSKHVGKADYKGRYSWTGELYLIKDQTKRQIRLSDLFGENSKEVEIYLNQKVKEEFDSLMAIPELYDCLQYIEFRKYKLDEFEIDYSLGGPIIFWIDYGTSGACFNVKLGSAKMSYENFDSLVTN